MKVGELRKQGFKAITGDTLTNGLSDSIKLSIGGAVAVNNGYHDELEIVDLLWRNDNDQECEFSGITDHSIDGWRPCFGQLSNADKTAIAIDEKPVFTKAMADNGELPPVGCKCLVKHKYADATWAQPDFNEKIITAYGNELMIFTSLTSNDNKESVGAISDYLFRPLDTRTEKQKAVDAAIAEWPVADKATLELAYDLWAPKIEQ